MEIKRGKREKVGPTEELINVYAFLNMSSRYMCVYIYMYLYIYRYLWRYLEIIWRQCKIRKLILWSYTLRDNLLMIYLEMRPQTGYCLVESPHTMKTGFDSSHTIKTR